MNADRHLSRLAEFWAHVRAGENKVAWLRRARTWSFGRPQTAGLKKPRRSPQPGELPCFVCEGQSSDATHYIVPLGNGGARVSANTVYLCADCQWKVERPSKPLRGRGALTDAPKLPRLIKQQVTR